MKNFEIKNKSTQELDEMLSTLTKESFKLRFQKSSGQLSNPSRINTVKKLIAKVNTFLNQRNKFAEKNNA